MQFFFVYVDFVIKKGDYVIAEYYIYDALGRILDYNKMSV